MIVWGMTSMIEANLAPTEAQVGVTPLPDFSKVSLESLFSNVAGPPRRFLLFRIVGMNVQQALASSKATQGQYNDWVCNDPDFQLMNSWVKPLSKIHRQEAIILLRRSNQLTAVILEEEIIERVLVEVREGHYDLLKLPIAKEVYNKLIAAMDATPVFNIREANFVERAREHGNIPVPPVINGEVVEIPTGAINDTHGPSSEPGSGNLG